jgi:hypothetical protein
MRLWASTNSITFDEFAPHLGQKVEVAFSLSPRYLGDRRTGDFPLDLSAMGDAGFTQLPMLGRTECALTGFLFRDERRIESAFSMRIPNSVDLDLLEKAEPARCVALGELSLVGKELSSPAHVFYPARIARFQSLCLTAGDARFGQWFDVFRYGDLGSDPDVIAAPVCVAELELLIE